MREGKVVFVYRADGQIVLSLSRLRQPVAAITEEEFEEIDEMLKSRVDVIHGGVV
jgi:hypothetical protein